MAVTAAPDAYRSIPLVVRARLSTEQARRISASAALSARFNRILRATSRRVAIGIQAVSPVKTGLFRRRWQAQVVGKTSIELSNSVKYAQYVHPKGTPRARTVANVDAPRVIAEQQAWLDAELDAQMGEALATVVLYETVAPPTTERERAEYAAAKRTFDDWLARVTSTNAIPGARVRL